MLSFDVLAKIILFTVSSFENPVSTQFASPVTDGKWGNVNIFWTWG